MTDDPPQAPEKPASRTCFVCSKTFVSEGQFCPFCGSQSIDASTTTAIDIYIKTKMDQEIARRFTDQSSLIREIGDKAEDIVWRRLRYFGLFLTCIAFLLAAFGLKTIDDVSKSIIKETSGKVDAIKGGLDQLGRDVDVQTKRVADKSSEISLRLEQLDAITGNAQSKVAAYQKRAEELSDQLEKRISELGTKVRQVSMQVDSVSVRQEYPELGQAKIVTYKGGKWDKAEKKQNEKFINIYIFPYALGDFSNQEIESLVKDLRAAGYTTLLGMFGIGGPYLSGVGELGQVQGSPAEASVYYFTKDAEQISAEVRTIALRNLPTKSAETHFVDSAAMGTDDPRRFVIENSGLDLQIVLRPLRK